MSFRNYIPNRKYLKKIADNAFHRSGLKRFTVPKSVEEIGDGCFSECFSLSEWAFEATLRRLGTRRSAILF